MTVQGQPILAHRAVLAAASRVWDAMSAQPIATQYIVACPQGLG